MERRICSFALFCTLVTLGFAFTFAWQPSSSAWCHCRKEALRNHQQQQQVRYAGIVSRGDSGPACQATFLNIRHSAWTLVVCTRYTVTVIATDKDLHILKPTASVHKTMEIDIAGPWAGESYDVHSYSLSVKQWVELTCSKKKNL